jgi:hypothetical protein
MKVLESRQAYRACGKNTLEKAMLAQSIVDFVESVNGRFLQQEKETGCFFVLPKKAALGKVKQALRDNYVPLWAR